MTPDHNVNWSFGATELDLIFRVLELRVVNVFFPNFELLCKCCTTIFKVKR